MTDWSIPRILNGHSLEYPTGFNNLPKNKKWIQFKHEFTNSSLLMSDGNSLTLTHWVIPTDWSMHAVKDNCLASRKSEWSHSWRALKIKNWLTISVLHFTIGRGIILIHIMTLVTVSMRRSKVFRAVTTLLLLNSENVVCRELHITSTSSRDACCDLLHISFPTICFEINDTNITTYYVDL